MEKQYCQRNPTPETSLMRCHRTFVLLVAAPLCSALACSPRVDDDNSETGLIGTVITDPPSSIELVYIPTGSFMMGSDNADDEDPPHEVHLSGFYIGKHEITQSQWQQVMGDNPADNVGSNHPVENVSWNDAVAFVAQLSDLTGQRYRLPTEAEWEYAARAGSTTDFYFGDDTTMLEEYAWHGGNADGVAHPVGRKTPNAWGLFDVAGNVWEWCQDWWDPDYYLRSDTLNPVNETPYVYTDPSTGEQFTVRVARSGAFRGPASGLESAHRHGSRPESKRDWIGLRVVRELDP